MLGHHQRFLFDIVLLSSLCRVSTALKPTISTTTDQMIIQEGESLRLVCYGNSDIFFIYPVNRTRAPNTVFSYTSFIQTNKTRDENGTYWYDFRRPNTVFGDTGWYGCSYHPLAMITMDDYLRRNNTDSESNFVYVYVQSIIDRFVEQAESHVLETYIGGDIVVPCRPTSPRTKVWIAKFVREESRFDKVSRQIYDPKFGFMLPSIDRYIEGTYICNMFTNQTVSYIIRLRKIILPELRILNDTLLHVIKGESPYLKCTAIIHNSDCGIYWNAPRQSNRINTWNDRRAITSNIFERTAFLVIEYVINGDAGIYECKLSCPYNETKSEMVIQVHESLDPFINLTTRDPNRHYECHEGEEVEWIVDVDTYPSAELEWLHGDEVIRSFPPPEESKYSTNNACCNPTLKIYRLDISDAGTYSIQASNRYKRETLNFTLDVTVGPKVYMSKPGSYYFRNQVLKTECYVGAFPKPNITWSYRKCPSYPSCDDGTLEYLTNYEEKGTVTRLVSTVWMATEMSGELTCMACNIVGCENATENVFVSGEHGEFGIILTKEPVAEGDDWELICAVSNQNYSDIINWSSESGPIVQSDKISIDRGRTQHMYRSILKIHNVKIEDSQEYICIGKSTGNLTRSTGYRLEVKAARAPIITDTNLKKEEIIIDLGSQGSKRVLFHCFADGMPIPSISWFKDGAQVVVINEKYKLSNNSQKLELEYPLEVDGGEYVCRAENRIGKIEVSQRITIKGFRIVSNRPIALIILVVMLAIVVLILVIYFALKVCRDRIMRRELMEAGLMHFEKGAVESLNPDLTVDEQADLLPYDNKWEFPREKLKLGKHLGSGAFGVVLKAEGLGICEGEAITTVAVKMVRRAPNLVYICALANELKIMVHLGKHLNVVNLLGACTRNILKRELLVIVEFCRFGNLHDYLLSHRSGFINQIDLATGKLDLSIGLDLLKRTSGVCTTNRIKSAELSSSANINCNSESDSVQCHAAATDFQDIGMSADDPVQYCGSTEHSCRGDYGDSNLKPICTQDLLSWAFQVARGMEYLSQRRVLHGDLAARNILLADDNVVKICDFGLAKSMYKEETYKKKSDCPLPIKWLAIETMRDRIFSTQSDIWSFGIVLWEFFTLAMTPYPGIEAEIVFQKLIEGYRMEQPEYAIPEVYEIMCQCWNAEPSLRPSFTELVDSVGNLLEDNVKAHYIELNAPYLDMNRTLLDGGKNDYLTMVSAPNHAVLSSPTHDCAVETSPMLNKEEEDRYVKPINVHERRAELARNRKAMKDHVVHPDHDSGDDNPPDNFELVDLT
ncbi:vascular endothelial growth factor receptor 1 [Megalopta genalis]|uniref:vascular endothelial growth factor receptor 1 n=1 Tax=Megalopta genalis TaxID=115081 RepID=UPI003FD6405F